MFENDKKLLKSLIKKRADEEDCEIISDNDNCIVTFDYNQEKDIVYYLETPSKEWLLDKFHIGKNAGKMIAKHGINKEELADMLLSKPESLAMLATLNNIYIFSHKDGFKDIVEISDVDSEEEIPMIMQDNVDGLLEYAGCYWHDKNSIIIDMSVINYLAKERVKEEKREGLWDSDLSIAVKDGLFVTLSHEIRHLGLENPFVEEYCSIFDPEFNKDKFNKNFDSLESEEGVEEWGAALYDDWKYHNFLKMRNERQQTPMNP